MGNDATRTPPAIGVRGLATLAFLKCQYDAGKDHVDLFVPFVQEAVTAAPSAEIRLEELRRLVDERHALSIPIPTLRTMAGRLVKRGVLAAEGGAYRRASTFPGEKREAPFDQRIKEMEAASEELARLLLSEDPRHEHAATTDDALSLVYNFFERMHLGMIVREDQRWGPEDVPVDGNLRFVAKCLLKALDSPGLKECVRGMLEGYVLRGALLLSDISNAGQSLSGLEVYFDSRPVLQMLGLEGEEPKRAMREAFDLLKGSGATICVFEETLNEIRRLLRVYEEHLSTPSGVMSLVQYDMARHLVSVRATASDMAQARALLETNVRALGTSVRKFPEHQAAYTLDERSLADALLARDQTTPDQRVWHDVHSIAAVLTLRRGERMMQLERARAVFVTQTWLLVKNAGVWFAREGGGEGIRPVVHVEALVNTVWLKKPTLARDLKLHELVLRCATVLRPTREQWERLMGQLRVLIEKGEVATDEAVAVVASELTEKWMSAQGQEPDGISPEGVRDIVARFRDEARKAAAGEFSQEREAVLQAAGAERAARVAAEERARAAAAGHAELEGRFNSERASRRLHDVTVSAAAGRVARVVSGVIWVFGCAVLATGLWFLLPGMFPSQGVMGIVIAWGCIALVTFVTLIGLVRGWSLKVTSDRFRRRVGRRVSDWMRQKD